MEKKAGIIITLMVFMLFVFTGTSFAGEIFDAIEKGDLKRVEELTAENPGVVNERDKNDFTPLHKAAYSGKLDVVKFLVEKGADVNVKDKYGVTPLKMAQEWGRTEIIGYLKWKEAKE